MTALKKLHDMGQSIWLDSISRELLESGTLSRYIANLSVTGLTSNPTLFEHAVAASDRYDATLCGHLEPEYSAERLFFDFALEDIVAAADLFRPIYDASAGQDGFASIEVSPMLADDAAQSVAEAKPLFARAGRPNVLIKVPGTGAGLVAIEALIAAGIPVNVTLLFSPGQVRAATESYLRGIEQRVRAGQNAHVPSVASLFVSRWDGATASRLPPALANRLGIAIAERTYKIYREILGSDRWRRLAEAGAQPQRLLWASTGTKDPALPAGYYLTALAAEGTVNTVPEKTLRSFAESGVVEGILDTDTAEADAVVEAVGKLGIDVDALAVKLQADGRDAFVQSWHTLLACIESKRKTLRAA
jgi:transaldolase